MPPKTPFGQVSVGAAACGACRRGGKGGVCRSKNAHPGSIPVARVLSKSGGHRAVVTLAFTRASSAS